MVAKDFYLGKWTITTPNGKAFPSGATLAIEEIGATECQVSWTDDDGVLHDLLKVEHDGTNMVGNPAEEARTTNLWGLTISKVADGRISGTVTEIMGDDEGNLAGTWGAEASTTFGVTIPLRTAHSAEPFADGQTL
jgi:hypothetical protein